VSLISMADAQKTCWSEHTLTYATAALAEQRSSRPSRDRQAVAAAALPVARRRGQGRIRLQRLLIAREALDGESAASRSAGRARTAPRGGAADLERAQSCSATPRRFRSG